MGKITFASVVSAIEQSDVFMTVKARICEAPEANLNGARVTEAFIDDIVSNEARYVGLPLYADKKALISGKYNRLGHLYDEKTGEFHSTQIGSFYKFEKQTNGESCSLVGYARIPKRNRKLSKAISELFADSALKFSFELSVGEYEELDDETILIDASENNYLEGTAIVTYPACEDAVALELVAQKADETRKGDEEMAEVENKAEVVETEASQPELAEEEKTEETASEENEEAVACKDKKKAEEEIPEKEQAEESKENAEVVIHETHQESHSTCAFDTNSGKEVCESVTIESHVSDVTDGELVETADGAHVAEVAEAGGDAPSDASAETPEEAPAETTETPVEQPTEQPTVKEGAENAPLQGTGDTDGDEDVGVVNVEQKKTAEQMIAELMSVINEMKSEIAELKEEKKAAENKTVTASINPFMSDISSQKTYSLLEKADKNMDHYSLLEKY